MEIVSESKKRENEERAKLRLEKLMERSKTQVQIDPENMGGRDGRERRRRGRRPRDRSEVLMERRHGMRDPLFITRSRGVNLKSSNNTFISKGREIEGVVGDRLVSGIVDFLMKWGVIPSLMGESRGRETYFPHIFSQMFFLNQYPPKRWYSPRSTPSMSDVDFYIRQERLEEGVQKAKRTIQSVKSFFPDTIKTKNFHEGRAKGEVNEFNVSDSGDGELYRYSCEVAWKIYEYFKQDFVCLGYKMPAECLKEEC